MLSQLAKAKSVTGLKQTRRAVISGAAQSVYIAEDADRRLRLELSQLCDEHGVPFFPAESMKALGEACGIKIGASSAAVLR